MTLLVIVFIICLLVYIPQAAKRNQKEQARASLKKGSLALRRKISSEWDEIFHQKLKEENPKILDVYDWCVGYIEKKDLPSFEYNRYYKSSIEKDVRVEKNKKDAMDDIIELSDFVAARFWYQNIKNDDNGNIKGKNLQLEKIWIDFCMEKYGQIETPTGVFEYAVDNKYDKYWGKISPNNNTYFPKIPDQYWNKMSIYDIIYGKPSVNFYYSNIIGIASNDFSWVRTKDKTYNKYSIIYNYYDILTNKKYFDFYCCDMSKQIKYVIGNIIYLETQKTLYNDFGILDSGKRQFRGTLTIEDHERNILFRSDKPRYYYWENGEEKVTFTPSQFLYSPENDEPHLVEWYDCWGIPRYPQKDRVYTTDITIQIMDDEGNVVNYPPGFEPKRKK